MRYQVMICGKGMIVEDTLEDKTVRVIGWESVDRKWSETKAEAVRVCAELNSGIVNEN